MKTIKIEMSDTIYSRLKVAGTKQYKTEITNPDYDRNYRYDPDGEEPEIPNPATIPNDEQTRDEYLAGVIDEAIKQILKTHEVNQAGQDAEISKMQEIDKLNITSTIL